MNNQEIFEHVAASLLANKENKFVHQLKLSNGEEIISICAGEICSDTVGADTSWINPVKINYVKNEQGQFNIILTSWFITAEKYFCTEIQEDHIIADLLVERGLAENYIYTNNLVDSPEQNTLSNNETPPASDHYIDPELKQKVQHALMEGRVALVSNGSFEIH